MQYLLSWPSHCSRVMSSIDRVWRRCVCASAVLLKRYVIGHSVVIKTKRNRRRNIDDDDDDNNREYMGVLWLFAPMNESLNMNCRRKTSPLLYCPSGVYGKSLNFTSITLFFVPRRCRFFIIEWKYPHFENWDVQKYSSRPKIRYEISCTLWSSTWISGTKNRDWTMKFLISENLLLPYPLCP